MIKYDHFNCKLSNENGWKVRPCNGSIVILEDTAGFERKTHADHVLRIVKAFFTWNHYKRGN